METRTAPTADDLARQAAELVASEACRAFDARGLFSLALSGGSTPWKMLQRLSGEELPWRKVHVFQVDERVAPDGDPARNLTHIQAQFLDLIDIPAGNVHAMPVCAGDLQDGAEMYGSELQRLAGHPPVLDLVHLGMGPDGHTASLLPGEDVLEEHERDVATTGVYQGHRRMTLTYPIINRARRILWLIAGEDKTTMLGRLLQADPEIPAGRVSQQQAVVMTDIQAIAGNRHDWREDLKKC